MRVLVVDDMSSMRKVMLHMLISLGHNNNDEASNGIEALKMLHLNEYDLLITDLHMPNLNGQQLLHKIRHDKKLRHLPVLMVTSEGDKEKILSVVAEQVTAFMIKPFSIDTLRKQLDWVEYEGKATVN